MKFPWRAHLEMMRPYTLAYPGMLAVAGAVLANSRASWPTALEVAVAVCFGWIAGLYSCDAFDKPLDKIAKPSRPLPSGRISTRTACQFMAGYAVLGLALAAHLSAWCVVLSLAVAALVLLYAAVLKARALWGHLCRGCLSGIAILFGAVALDPSAITALWPLAIALVLHDAATNVIGAIRDVEGDRRGGYFTAPVKYGIPASLGLALGMGGGAFVLIFSRAGSWQSGSPCGPVLLLLAAALFAAAVLYGVFNRRRLSRRIALQIHNVLIVERLALAAGLMALSIVAYWPFAVFAVLALLSIMAIRRWRSRHEFLDASALRTPS